MLAYKMRMLFDFQRPPAWDFMTKRTRNNKNALMNVTECIVNVTVKNGNNICEHYIQFKIKFSGSHAPNFLIHVTKDH